MEKAPITLQFLCHVISERQKINRIRFNAHALQRKASKDIRLELSRVYSDCQEQMKQLSKIISYVRKQLNIEAKWGGSSNIEYIKFGDSVYKAKHIDQIGENYLLDKCIIPELDTYELPAYAEAMQTRYEEIKKKHKETL